MRHFSGEQFGAGLGEPHVSSGLVQPQPTVADREIEAQRELRAASLTTQPVKGNWLGQAVVSIRLENLKTLLFEARNSGRQIYCVH
jgi:hypothetical protein